MKQNKKHQEQKRIDPDEDLHLQDLEYKKNGEGKKHQQRDQIDEEGEKNLYKKKHNKVGTYLIIFSTVISLFGLQCLSLKISLWTDL